MRTPPPDAPEAVVFVDGQNLFDSLKKAFGYTYPNYDVLKLSTAICERQGWKLNQIRFYTGVPDVGDNPNWYYFWKNKFRQMKREWIYVFERPVRYHNRTITCPDGELHQIRLGHEKGIDVRIAIDSIRLAHKRRFDVALFFSQDQDFNEIAKEIRDIAIEQQRWIKIASAFPENKHRMYMNRGIDKTDWIPFDKEIYDKCIDEADYRFNQE